MTSFNPFEFDYEDVDRNDFAEKGKQYMKQMATCIENYSDGIVAAEYGASIMNSWEDVNQFLQANTDIDATKLLHIAAFNIENRLYKFKRTNNRMNKAKTKRSHSTKFECTTCKESILAVTKTEDMTGNDLEENRVMIRVMSQHNKDCLKNQIVIVPPNHRNFGDILSNNSKVISHVSQNIETINGFRLRSFVKNTLSIFDSLSLKFYNETLRTIKEYIVKKQNDNHYGALPFVLDVILKYNPNGNGDDNNCDADCF